MEYDSGRGEMYSRGETFGSLYDAVERERCPTGGKCTFCTGRCKLG